MSSITIDYSGRKLPSQRPHDDGWDYFPEPRITQAGDQLYSDYGGRWLPCVVMGFHMPDCLRYRRPKAKRVMVFFYFFKGC